MPEKAESWMKAVGGNVLDPMRRPKRRLKMVLSRPVMDTAPVRMAVLLAERAALVAAEGEATLASQAVMRALICASDRMVAVTCAAVGMAEAVMVEAEAEVVAEVAYGRTTGHDETVSLQP